MTHAEIKQRLDDIYAGRRRLATGSARTRELILMLGPEGRRRALAAITMCPRGLRGQVGD